MKKHLLVWILLVCLVPAWGQLAPVSYVVMLKDKDTVSHSLSAPQSFLSAKAIEKRQRFKIPVQYMDLPVSAAYLDTLSKLDSGIVLLTCSKWFNYAVIGTYDSLGISNSVLKKIEAFPWVTAIYPPHQIPDSLFEACMDAVTAINAVPLSSSDTMYYKEEPLPYEYFGESASQLAALNGLFLHRRNLLGKDMLVAVLDNGFWAVDSLYYFRSFREGNALFCVMDKCHNKKDLFKDAGRHGMYVLSIMALNEPYDYIGSAPEARYALIRTEEDDYEDILEEYFWVAGAEAADSIGADVVNSSLGYTTFDRSEQNHTWEHLNGKHSFASIAAEKLCRTAVVNISAGNSGNLPWHLFGIPSDAPSALSVAAMSSDSLIASFSSVGGEYWYKPDITSVGWKTAFCSSEDVIRTGDGTSFSSPLNAGLTACLWQAFPEKTAVQVMQAVRESCHLYPLFDSLFGYGIPDYEKAFYLLSKKTGTDNGVGKTSFLVYPNPARDICRIESDGGNAQLINVFGQVIKQFTLESPVTNLSLGGLPAGVYFLRVSKGNRVSVRKIEIVR